MKPQLHPLYLRSLLRRSFIVWLLARITLLAVSAAPPLGEPVLAMTPVVALVLLPSLALFAQIDARAMRETLFHANLGTPRLAPAVISLIVASLLELTIAVIAGVAA